LIGVPIVLTPSRQLSSSLTFIKKHFKEQRQKYKKSKESPFLLQLKYLFVEYYLNFIFNGEVPQYHMKNDLHKEVLIFKNNANFR